MAKLDKNTRNKIQAAEEVRVKKLELPSKGLTIALDGGIGYGRFTTIWGNRSGGKTAMCFQMIAKAQREKGDVAAFIDAEGTFDPEWAKKLGVDTKQLIHSPVKSMNDMVAVAVDLIKAGVDICVVDSVSALLSGAFFDKDSNELKELDGTKQIGSQSRDLGNALMMLNYVNEKTAVVLISQMRNKIGTYNSPPGPSGGNALEHFETTRIKLWSTAQEAKQLTGENFVGDKVFVESIGRPVKWTVEKNKIGLTGRSGQYDFYYGGKEVGIDYFAELVSLGEQYGKIVKGGAWYNLYDQKFQGSAKVVNYLRENPEVVKRLEADLDESLPHA